MNVAIPALVTKALADTGYDLLSVADDGWIAAAISGSAGRVLVQAVDEGVLLAVAEPTMAQRIGLASIAVPAPQGMADIGIAHGAIQLYEALRVLHSLVQATVNKVMLRFAIFAFSSLVLMGLVALAAKAVFQG